MLRLTRSQIQPIGIDIGHDAVKMLQLEVCGQSLSVRAAARQELPEDARANEELRLPRATELIRRMLCENGFRGRRAVVALPRQILHMKNFRLPIMPAAEIESAVALESQQLFPFEADEALVQYLPAGEVRQGNDTLQEVIVLAARKEDVNNFVEQLHRCGVTVDSLDAAPCALYRGVERFVRRRQDELEVQVLVDVGLTHTQVVIGQGREISFIKAIELGGRHLHEAIARKLSISYDEALTLRKRLMEARESESAEKRDPVRQAVTDAMRMVMEQLGREISLCLRYQSVTFRGHRPGRLRLLGGEGRDPQLRSILGSLITIPVEMGRPLCSVDISRMRISERAGSLGEWAVALGLALKRCEGRFAPRDGRPRGSEPILPPEEEDGDEATPAEVATVGAEAASAPAAATVAAMPVQEASHA